MHECAPTRDRAFCAQSARQRAVEANTARSTQHVAAVQRLSALQAAARDLEGARAALQRVAEEVAARVSVSGGLEWRNEPNQTQFNESATHTISEYQGLQESAAACDVSGVFCAACCCVEGAGAHGGRP